MNFGRIWSVSNQTPSAPYLTTLTSKLQRHLTCLREIWVIYKKKRFSRNFKNPKKFWKSGKNWNSRFQNFEKIDLIILPNRSNRSNCKKSLNRLDRFIGQQINRWGVGGKPKIEAKRHPSVFNSAWESIFQMNVDLHFTTWKLCFLNISEYLARYGIQKDP